MEAGTIVEDSLLRTVLRCWGYSGKQCISIRHSTRNFPNREGSKLQSGQIASVALMDARSIAATAANKGFLTPATDFDIEYKNPTYHLIPEFTPTVYLTATALLILRLRSNSDRTSKTGRQ